REEPAFKALLGCTSPVFLLINKIDLVKPDTLLPVIASYSEQFPFREIFPISALRLSGTEELLRSVSRALPVHPALYPAESLSEHSERFFVAELIREKIIEKFRDEIPYSTAVQIAEFKEAKGRKDVIQAEIFVERDSQKGILIGNKGSALKDIGEKARKEIE